MTEITIQESTYERLQQHARPFIDTPETVIIRALDALDKIGSRPPQSGGRTQDSERRIDYRALPSLTHTKILDASIDGHPLVKANWNLLLDAMVRRAMKRTGSFEKLQRLCQVNMVRGRKEDEGYGYLADIDVSVQGQDANAACRAVITIAKGLGIPLDIGFMWRPKEGAAYPGEIARLTIPGLQAKAGTVAA